MSLLHRKHHHSDPPADPAPHESAPQESQTNMTDPSRQGTMNSTGSGAAIPDEKVELASVLEERLRAWKHVVAYLEAYVEGAAQVQKHLGSHYEKLAKLIAEPLKEGQMFDSVSNNGVLGMFEHLRKATHDVSQAGYQGDKDIKGHVLKELERLHKEIKSKDKELLGGALKATKEVDKARSHTQRALEELGRHTATYDAGQGNSRIEPQNDPYLVKRAVLHKLNKQVAEENALKQDMVVIQDNFKRYEQHIVETIHQAVGSLYNHISAQADRTKAAYSDVVGLAQRISPDYEWTGFAQRYGHVLADASTPARSLETIEFPNQSHGATNPLVSGALQRKGKLFGKYSSHQYVITPAKYLHEFDDNDDLANSPEPEMSLYLPECTIGGLSPAPGAKFVISGKDSQKNKNLTREHEFTFKAGSHEEARRFYDAIVGLVGNKSGGMTPPVVTPQASGDDTQISGVIGHPPPSYEQSTPADEKNQHQATPVAAAAYTTSPIEQNAPQQNYPVEKEAHPVQQKEQHAGAAPVFIQDSKPAPFQQQQQQQQQQQTYANEPQPQAVSPIAASTPIASSSQPSNFTSDPTPTQPSTSTNTALPGDQPVAQPTDAGKPASPAPADSSLLPGDRPISTVDRTSEPPQASVPEGTAQPQAAGSAPAPQAAEAPQAAPQPGGEGVKDVKFESQKEKSGGLLGSLKRGFSKKK